MKPLVVIVFAWMIASAMIRADILQIRIEGVIGPASSDYLEHSLQRAQEEKAEALLITLDTPGGLLSSTREMVQMMTNSSVPVIAYVYPRGAHAASAGTFLLYAAHVAAMSGGTNIGAATPVAFGMRPAEQEGNKSASPVLERKVLNDATAYIKSLAQLNERNVTWALDAVREAKSLTAKEALASGVIDYVADDVPSLLAQVDGKEITLLQSPVVLRTKNVPVVTLTPDWKTQILSVVTQPNVAYLFLLAAMYGIFFELMNPGAVFPGVIGAISGVIALYAFNILPFNYAGLLLIFLGVAFMAAEVFVAGFGVLGIGGVVAFTAGSLLLFDAQTLGQSVSVPLVLALALVSLGFFLFTMRLFLSGRKLKAQTGREEMVGATGSVTEVLNGEYRVLCHGELWHARSGEVLSPGDPVVVVALEGLTLMIGKAKE